MSSNSTLERIGIVDQASAGWAAASSYTNMLLRSLGAACRESQIELCLLAEADKLQPFDHQHVELISRLPITPLPGEGRLRKLLRMPARAGALRGEERLRHWLRLSDNSSVFSSACAHAVDVLLPVFDLPPWSLNVKTIGWIPDFQHIYLPEFFSAPERERRDNTMRRLADKATLIMLSSRSALEHFTAFAPAQVDKARVVSFPSLFAFVEPDGDATASVSRYNLPEKFALVANQFWAHKNHLIVVEALKQLSDRGVRVTVVMTGLPSDHRDPANHNLSRLLQAIAAANLSAQVTLLGQVPYSDLMNLMRAAALVIQPSRFEGWSTIVEDAKALGRPLLCSDIAVHLEQAPDALGYFACDDAAALAALLASHWPTLAPGPDAQAEAKALAAEREFASQHGQLLLSICREAYES